MTIYTIGHSTHEPDAFAGFMHAAKVGHAIDIRSHFSSKWEWWTEPNIEPWMNEHHLKYSKMVELGGWNSGHMAPDLVEWADARGVNVRPYLRGYFPKQHIGRDREEIELPEEHKSKWYNNGLNEYALYTSTSEFLEALENLIADHGSTLAPDAAIFCAEAPWWKCHRSMVADVLTFAGQDVYHLMPGSKKTPVRVKIHTPRDRISRYSTEVRGIWSERFGLPLGGAQTQSE